jgi:nucleotide-binding universal stress UspA family protein
MLPLKKILCPTDFSEPSYEAIKAAKELALYFQAELFLIHVITPTPFIPEIPSVAAPRLLIAEQEIESYAKKSLGKLVEKFELKNRPVHLMVLVGNPADEIVRIANEEKVDVIVIATHGRTGLNRLIFGSVAERTVRLADCPVLTISSQTSWITEKKSSSKKE